MKKDTVFLLFEKLYPNLEIKTVNFLPRQQLNESGEWVKDSPSIFIGIKYHEDCNYDSIREDGNISEFLTILTGFEFNVFIE